MDALIDKLLDTVVNPLIALVFGLAVIIFFWGVFQYLIQSSEPDKRALGGQHILWGVIGMAIMLSAYGIVNVIIRTIGV